ncbi:MAG TPA: 6-phosphogluconolactonase [Mycobacteriales bacterium]|nr:6-phosphogluconolactonase [Mycobacteriales bacterium]
MTGTLLVVAPDRDTLAALVAGRLIAALADAQAQRPVASAVLTGGGIGLAVLAATAASPARGAVDWSRLDVWWGDERFVPAGDSDRNDRGADEALLAQVPVDPRRVHRIGGPDTYSTPEQAAGAYSAQLLSAGSGRTPDFDVLLAGIGPEGHVASLFPHAPGLAADTPAVAVRDCPKPPPTRVSLTLPAICAAREVWVIASGTAKAEAVAGVLAGGDIAALPARGARGHERTVCLVDADAAAAVPR